MLPQYGGGVDDLIAICAVLSKKDAKQRVPHDPAFSHSPGQG